jgi:hypothetical protein
MDDMFKLLDKLGPDIRRPTKDQVNDMVKRRTKAGAITEGIPLSKKKKKDKKSGWRSSLDDEMERSFKQMPIIDQRTGTVNRRSKPPSSSPGKARKTGKKKTMGEYR